MRTKALLLGAAIGAVSLATSMAQVYSVNIVGYVNTSIPHGWSIIANPLNASGGNTIGSVMPNPPCPVTIYKFRNSTGTYLINSYDADFQMWDDDTMTVNPGEGLFIKNNGTNFTWTFVGEVPTGTQSMNIYHGFNLISSMIPQTGRISTDLGYVPSANQSDVIYNYVNATGIYQIFIWDSDFQEWDPEPSIPVGTGVFLLRGDTGSTTWSRVFNVGN